MAHPPYKAADSGYSLSTTGQDAPQSDDSDHWCDDDNVPYVYTNVHVTHTQFAMSWRQLFRRGDEFIQHFAVGWLDATNVTFVYSFNA